MNIHSKKILTYISEKRVVTSSEIAQLLGISWNTADSHLKDLALASRIERIKKAGVNLWLKK